MPNIQYRRMAILSLKERIRGKRGLGYKWENGRKGKMKSSGVNVNSHSSLSDICNMWCHVNSTGLGNPYFHGLPSHSHSDSLVGWL